MAIDGSDVRLSPDSAQRVEALRRVERDTPSGGFGSKDSRGKQNRRDPQTSQFDLPQDIVDLHSASSADQSTDHPPTPRADAYHTTETERHLDIEA
jgi:hypothetical protein